MIRRKERLIPAAMLIALFLLARAAGADVISYSPTEYTVFAAGDVGVGDTTGGSQIGRMVRAGGDVTFATDVIVSDMGGYSGSVFANDDVIIGDSAYITGPVQTGGESANPPKGDAEVGNYSQAASLYAAGIVVILTNADIGVSDNAQDVHGNGATIGTDSEVWGNFQHSGKLNNSTLHLDCITDGRLAPGTYTNLIGRALY